MNLLQSCVSSIFFRLSSCETLDGQTHSNEMTFKAPQTPHQLDLTGLALAFPLQNK